MAWVLDGHAGPSRRCSPCAPGIISGAFCWFGFVLTTMAVNNAFRGRKPMLTVIDGGHWLGVLVIIGAIIGAGSGRAKPPEQLPDQSGTFAALSLVASAVA